MSIHLLITNLEKHISLDESEKLLLQQFVKLNTISKGDFLLKTGQVCQFEYFIITGSLRSFYIDNNGIEHSIFFAKEGWWTGNLKSFINKSPSEFNLQTIDTTQVIQFNTKTIEELYSKIPKLERYFRILLQNRLIKTQDRISAHLSTTAVQRYLEFTEQYQDFEQRIPQKYIASYLGITPSYLSRLRKRMSRSIY